MSASTTPAISPELQAKRKAYYERLSGRDMAPLWEVLKDIIPTSNRTSHIFLEKRNHLAEGSSFFSHDNTKPSDHNSGSFFPCLQCFPFPFRSNPG